jgi:hypothetical protein
MKHWSNGVGWEMTNSVCEKFQKKTQNVMVVRRLLSLSADEVTTIDNQFCISIHVYVIQAWRRVLVLTL